jgi:hypothetical protein
MKGLSREELVWLDRFNQALENAIAEGPYRFVEEFYDFLNAKSDLDARIAKSVVDLVTYMVKNGIARESVSGAKSLDFRKVLGPKSKLKFKNGKIFYNSGVVKHAYDPEFFPIYYDVKDWSGSRLGWNDVLVGMGHDIKFATLHNRSNIVYWPESFEELLELPNQIEEAIKKHRANQ